MLSAVDADADVEEGWTMEEGASRDEIERRMGRDDGDEITERKRRGNAMERARVMKEQPKNCSTDPSFPLTPVWNSAPLSRSQTKSLIIFFLHFPSFLRTTHTHMHT